MLLFGALSAWAQPADPPVSTLGESDVDALGSMPEEGSRNGDVRGLAEGIPAPSDASDAEEVELDRFRRALESYEREAAEYREDLSRLVQLEHDDRTRDVHIVYDGAIDSLREEERRLRLEAIERLKAFVVRYPASPPQTPDAMFRLAELFFEKESDDFIAADSAYMRLLDQYESGEVSALPEEPQRDYENTVAWFRRLTTEFPDYRQADGAYYLMGAALQEMGESEAANDAFLRLALDFPESSFAQEAWVRIGEHAFEFLEYHSAAAAYTRALDYGSVGRLYDEALFKLGWAQYLNNHYQEALDAFVSLINHYDNPAGAVAEAGALRAEALQYLAVVLAELDWNLDGERDHDAGLARVRSQLTTGASWELEALDRLIGIWFDGAAYELAIEGSRHALALWPTDRRNPERSQQIVTSLNRIREIEAAFAEQLAFSEQYGSASEWYAYQRETGNVQAIAYAEELVRTSLLDSARYYNQRADLLRDQSLEDPELEGQAIDAFRMAAEAYSDFLARYPGDRQAYEVRFLLAQALYSSFDFLNAAVHYSAVASMVGPRQELAAYSVVRSIEAALADEIAAGTAEAHSLPTLAGIEQSADDRQTHPLPLHPLSEMLVGAYDGYVALGLNPAEDPTVQGRFALLAGMIYFDHNQMDEARSRFEAILENRVYRAQESALLAATLLIGSYQIEGNFEEMELCAERMGQLDFGGEHIDPAVLVEFDEDMRTQRTAAAFLAAEALFRDQDYEVAAEAFVQVANQAPESEFATVALHNAAVAYERAARFELAMGLYERVVAEYPESELVSEVLYRIAVMSHRVFDFERAIQSYLIFASRPDVGVERALTAAFSAAELQYSGGQYREAARTYERFGRDFVDHENVPIALYRAGLMYELDQRFAEMERAWRRLWETAVDSTSSEQLQLDAMVIDSLRRTADYYAEVEGNTDEAERLYSDVVDEYFMRGSSDVESGFSAGKAQFWLVGREFELWEQTVIEGSNSQQRLIVNQLLGDALPIIEGYMEVGEFNSAEWTTAAYYMIGRVHQSLADRLYEVPVPPEIGPLDLEPFLRERERVIDRFEEEAIENWQFAAELARETGIVNEWTIDTLRELNRYLGDEFPLFREEIEMLQDAIISPLPVSGPPVDGDNR